MKYLKYKQENENSLENEIINLQKLIKTINSSKGAYKIEKLFEDVKIFENKKTIEYKRNEKPNALNFNRKIDRLNRSLNPINKEMDIYYFEIKILESFTNSTSIGLVPNSYSGYDQPGWKSMSCGLVFLN
jgi:hypothetical protein